VSGDVGRDLACSVWDRRLWVGIRSGAGAGRIRVHHRLDNDKGSQYGLSLSHEIEIAPGGPLTVISRSTDDQNPLPF